MTAPQLKRPPFQKAGPRRESRATIDIHDGPVELAKQIEQLILNGDGKSLQCALVMLKTLGEFAHEQEREAKEREAKDLACAAEYDPLTGDELPLPPECQGRNLEMGEYSRECRLWPAQEYCTAIGGLITNPATSDFKRQQYAGKLVHFCNALESHADFLLAGWEHSHNEADGYRQCVKKLENILATNGLREIDFDDDGQPIKF